MRGPSAYLAFARMAARQAARDRGELYGRVVFVAVILAVFSALWRATAEAGLGVARDRGALIWYLAVTEWILLSVPAVHLEIEDEIRRGDVACQLVRPVSYPLTVMARGVGVLAVRAPVIAVAAFVCGVAFGGRLPPLPATVGAVTFGAVAMLLIYALYAVIGLTAFWIGNVAAVFWVSQKLLFVFGGLMLPLAFYPEWMQQVAAWTPFPAVLAGPAGFMLGDGVPEAWSLAGRLLVWGTVMTGVLAGLFRLATRTLQVQGG